MLPRPALILALACLAAAMPAARSAQGDAFVVKPYLQLGDRPSDGGTGDLSLLWHAEDVAADWQVEYRPGPDRPWRKAEAPASRRIALVSPRSAPIAPHRVYSANLVGLAPGGTFAYRVSKGGSLIFEAEGKARKGADQPYRFVAVGDIAQGTDAQRRVAFEMGKANPDFLMWTGDIVYSRGRISEYRAKYFPVYNADLPGPTTGAPLLRTTLTVASPGNHDIAARDLENYPDGLAYFYYWDLPRNGPESGPFTIPITGPEANQAAFFEASGPNYPRLANYAFDYGNAHWTVLDSNPYVDWRDPALRDWVAKDLAAARGATWRFVSFHHPGFNSSRAHFGDQEMRLLADLFEGGKVDVVFSGHVHNYQRSFPLKFAAERDPAGKMVRDGNLVPGSWTLDKSFDGKANTRPDGVIYLVTGGGGATLYNAEQQDQPRTWQSFTEKFVSKVHSFTVVEVEGKALNVRQVSDQGVEVDAFRIAK